MNNTLDVFVKFYAPWCSECQDMAAAYEALAASLIENQGLKLFEIDGTANEVPQVTIDQYPKLILFPGHDKTHPIPYENATTTDMMLQFLKKYAHNPIKKIKSARKT